MSRVIELTVEKSTATKNGNFANKLVGKGQDVETDFGTVEGGRRTFYMFTNSVNTVGKKASIDLDHFDMVPNEFPFTDEDGDEQIATLNYLYPKRK